MTFEEYQKKSRETVIYPEEFRIFYPVLGLSGEAGEVAEKIKRIYRENDGIVNEETKEGIEKELGDVLWYLSQIATEMGLSLDKIASVNIEKLQSRKQRGELKGFGDKR